jgi:hypothetical protein
MHRDLIKMLAGSVVRHGLTALSAYLVTQNLLAPEHATGFSTTVYNALPGVLAFGWSLVQKVNHHEAVSF